MKKGWIIAGVLLLAAAGTGGYLYHSGIIEFGGASSDQTVYVTKISTLMGTDTAGVQTRYAGIVEPQNTIEVNIDSGRVVNEVSVKVGDEVKQGQLLFEYDLSSLQSDLQQAQLDLERLQNEALSLESQIATLEKEKKSASADNQLSYTIEIETNKMNLKKNEYDQISKTAEIEKLESATGNTEVRSEIDGIIQKIDTSKMNSGDDSSVTDTLEDDSSYSTSDSSDSAFITILSTGAYRVKGTVNELNINNIVTGSSVIIRSRVDESQTWTGVMGSVDMDSASQSSDSSSYFGYSSDSSTSSSSYPFYVDLNSSDGLMLGQHVYIELDEGQLDQKDGLWLSDYFIVGTDTEDPYVWVANDKNRLVKQSVILGNYDDALMEYEIVDGVTEDSLIAFPTSSLEEGMSTVVGTGEQTMEAMFESYDSEDDFTEYEDEELYEDDGALFDDSGEMIYDESELDESDMEDIVIEDDFEDMVIEIDESMPEEYMEDTYDADSVDESVIFDDDLEPIE